MVNTRPSPTPARGRVAYPSADSYTPGDTRRPPRLSSSPPYSIPNQHPKNMAGPSPDNTGKAAATAGATATGTAVIDSSSTGSTASTSGPSMGGPSAQGHITSPVVIPERGSGSSLSSGGGPGAALRRLRSPPMREPTQRPVDRDVKPERAPVTDSKKVHPSGTTLTRELSERERNTLGLRQWWKTFMQRERDIERYRHQPQVERSFKRAPVTMTTRRVFGVPLKRVLEYSGYTILSNVPCGTFGVYSSSIPTVLAVCGRYIRHSTDIPGIFRVSGSEKRMRELQAIFDEGPMFGADLDFSQTTFTPHDVATIFRRYLTMMPEPVIPFRFYDYFRRVEADSTSDAQVLDKYIRLILQMPASNRDLLLYVLDLLGCVADNSERNLMGAANLALIFQPGVLHHESHIMEPKQSGQSKQVLEYLIEHEKAIIHNVLPRLTGNSTSDNPILPPSPVPVDPTTVPLPPTPPSSHTPTPPPQEHPMSPRPEGVPPTILESSPQGGSSALPSDSGVGKPERPRGRKLERNDSAYMAPSDSDEDEQKGGLIIIEVPPRTTSSLNPSPPSQSPPNDATVVGALIPPPRPHRRRRLSSSRNRPHNLNLQSGQDIPGGEATPTAISSELLAPSDSDEETPTNKQYVMYENKHPHRVPLSDRMRASPQPQTSTSTSIVSPVPSAAMGTAKSRVHGGHSLVDTGPVPHQSRASIQIARPDAAGDVPSESKARPLDRSRSALAPAEGRANNDNTPQRAGSGLFRRRTLPTKRVSDFTARMRRAVREA